MQHPGTAVKTEQFGTGPLVARRRLIDPEAKHSSALLRESLKQSRIRDSTRREPVSRSLPPSMRRSVKPELRVFCGTGDESGKPYCPFFGSAVERLRNRIEWQREVGVAQ